MNTKPAEKGSIAYHNRVDFRALDVFVQAINNATKDELKQAQATCKERIADLRFPMVERPTWKSLSTLIHKEIRRF